MVDLQKVNLSSEDKGRYLTFFADLRLHTEQRIDKDLLFRMNNQAALKQEVCKDLLRAIHYHLYGELHGPLAELAEVCSSSIPLNDFSKYERARKLLDKIQELLKKP